MDSNSQQKFKVSPDALFQKVAGETVLLNVSKETYYGLNETGTRIWELLGEGQAARQIAASIHEEFDTDLSTAQQDVGRILKELQESGLLIPVAGPSR